MEQRIKNAILATFVADAFSLGVHWVYDVSAIKNRYGRIETMVKPELASYHAGKTAGDFTHYGDQMLVLLESVTACNGFDFNDFNARWQTLFESYDGYMDAATKETCNSLAKGESIETAGSSSTDLSGASRLSPVFLIYQNDTGQLIRDARAQAAMTHNHADVLDTAEWTARAAARILEGQIPVAAMEQAASELTGNPTLVRLINRGLDSKDSDTLSVIRNFGQMCSLGAALPSAVHLVAKYENDFKTAMIENVMAGGDSSARGMLAALLIGCHLRANFIPDTWLDEIKEKERVLALLE